ncbi:type 1 glutamine amidotransferase [Arenibaculum sp.]|uniref:type 1 glutamine amidotransferase n=1 Tax=Arenibaculum sp. TaxID=2865862 RepID=UPI002E133B85|nr:type 1 glutamine amidotransferase [Arenibaculum sp.]
MRILVVENSFRAPAGLIGEALAAAGADLVTVTPAAAADLPATMSGYAGAVVLGGAQSATDDASSPWLPHLLDLIRQCRDQRRPVLGVCLGAQLIARALGNRVYPLRVPEFGFETVAPTGTAAADPVFGGIGAPPRVFQWHYDTFDLPAGALLLATGEACRNQAFVAEDVLYGVQFHPEVTEGIVRGWIDAAAGVLPPGGVRLAGRLGEEFTGREPAAAELAATIAGRWLRLCAVERERRNGD